jgi:capsular polysaccharide biosynthesis protein
MFEPVLSQTPIAPKKTIVVFSSSYPTPDVALPIDDRTPYLFVSCRALEPPPGHSTLRLKAVTGIGEFISNLLTLRTRRRDLPVERSIVLMVPVVSHLDLLINVIYAIALGRPVTLFNGRSEMSFRGAHRNLSRAMLAVPARALFGGTLTRLRRVRGRRTNESFSATREASLFGHYTKAQSFSLPLDQVTLLPPGESVYGNVRGFFLPAYSARKQRFSVRTTRHRLRDVSLHVESVAGYEQSCLLQGGRLLTYPYLILPWHSRGSYSTSTRDQVTTLAGGICLLAYTTTYYHWLLEGVPRILDLIDDAIDFDRYPLILPPLPTFQRELLLLLGISPSTQVVTVDKGDWCHVEDCIFPTAPFAFGVPDLEDPSGQPERRVLQRVRERLLDKIPMLVEDESGPSKVYISRALAARRRFSDETEASVKELLESFGYRTLYLEEYPWEMQVRLLRFARSIVGFHGAGLTNIIFSEAKHLLEFTNPMEARPYFAVIAREMGIEYNTLVGSTEGLSPNFDNITIDLGALRDTLLSMED